MNVNPWAVSLRQRYPLVGVGGRRTPRSHGLRKTLREELGLLAAVCPLSQTGSQFLHYFSPKVPRFCENAHLVCAIQVVPVDDARPPIVSLRPCTPKL